jgi:dephospho-CoA kinase
VIGDRRRELKMVGFVGMPGSGKSVAADVARDMGVPVIVMGDVIREEAARLGLEPTDQNLGQVGNELRKKHGPNAVAERCLQKMQSLKAPLVVIEGIRSKAEVDFFREKSQDFLLVEVWVPDDVRMRRIASRGRSDDACGEELEEAMTNRDQRELGWGMGEAIRSADVRVENAGTVKEFREKAKEMLEEYLEARLAKSKTH